MTIINKGLNIIRNIVGSSYLLEIGKLSKIYKNTVIALDNNHQIDALHSEISSFYNIENIHKFPDYGTGYYDIRPIDKSIIKDRYNTLIDLVSNNTKNRIIIATYKSLFYKIPRPFDVSNSWKQINLGTKYEEIITTLNSFNYHKTSKVTEPGQFRVSGSIIDFFSVNSEKPIRINFFGDEIETIKEFDISTLRSSNNVDSTIICSDGVYSLTSNNIEYYKDSVKNYFNEEYLEDIEYEKIVSDNDSRHIHNLIPLLFNDTSSILSLLDGEFACYSQKNILEELENQTESAKNIYENEKLNRYILKYDELLVSKNDLSKTLAENYSLVASDYIYAENEIKSSFKPLPSLSINYNFKNPFTNFEKYYANSKYNYIFFIKRDDNYRTITNYFDSEKILYEQVKEIDSGLKKIQILRSDISEGFIDNSTKTVYVSSNDLFGLIKTRLSSSDSIKSTLIDDLSQLKLNDLVVHRTHGIGKYSGMETMNIENKVIELIKLEYANNDNFYMPVTSISSIQRYIGNTSLNTKLSQLGSDRWIKIKQRAKRKIEDIAAVILLTQAKRKLSKSYEFEFNNHEYERFCNLFPYVETNDQLDSINDVISDMCSSKPMDRIICGDVGFGKTEVILRAAFIAAQNKKQVAIIVPTTVLARQHFQTFKTRFANYDYEIELITRSLSPNTKVKIINRIKDKKVHILIGTHALLNKDIKYNDLGLLIVDEEHKFGVKHKELLKTTKENVDVLTLTATPIPRTLNSALSEIRDMSIINTPPLGRKNIETSIIDKSTFNYKNFIDREISRGGQVLYIHNRIQSMDSEIEYLQNISSDYSVKKVHGRLPNQEVELIMNEFLNEKINILVCTSIIESGLDMTNVNTIIINDAQNFGLSQLHQIRGRVGRSEKQAYAALVLCDTKNITSDAQKRLDAFIRTDSLAGGLDIAGHDLEIRGAGEILGEEQSGQIFEIGYGMYTSMLSRAINQIKNKNDYESYSPADIDSYISTLIPQEYVEDIFLRLELYNDISKAKNDSDIDHIATKMEDIYGPLPEYLTNLLNLTRVRIAADRVKVEKIKINRSNIDITLCKKSNIDQDKLINKYVSNKKIKVLGQYHIKYYTSMHDSFDEICKDAMELLQDVCL